MSTGPRDIALSVISDVTERNARTENALLTYEAKDSLTERDMALAARISKGTIKRLIELDSIISCYSNTPVSKLDSNIKNIIRICLYQLIYMDHIPIYAAANEAVKQASFVRHGRYKGFVNAVIRHFIRDMEKAGGIKEAYPKFLDNLTEKMKKSEALSVVYSVPEWIVKMWLADYGDEKTEEILRGFMHERGMTLRANTIKTDDVTLGNMIRNAGYDARISETVPNAIVVDGRIRADLLPGYDEGLFYVMDLSSMLPPIKADIKEGDAVLDVCCAPGGKSMIAAMLCGESGSITSRDKNAARLKIVNDNIRRLGLKNIKTELGDASVQMADDDNKYDVVLADLPCSGLGVLSHKPESKYRLKQTDISSLAALQFKILCNTTHALKAGGTLAYSTCTISRMENEENTKAFLASHSEYRLISEEQIIPTDEHDGFYLAIMRKNTDG